MLSLQNYAYPFAPDKVLLAKLVSSFKSSTQYRGDNTYQLRFPFQQYLL